MPTRYEKPWWDDRTKQMASIMRDVEKERREADIFSTPKSIYKYFDKRLFGCHEYKKALSTAIWSSINLKTKTNFLVIGPSGCGKTELARILSNVYYNTTIFDASTVAPVSYKGTVTMSQCLLEVDTSDHAKPAWIFIDEIDKALLKESELAPMIMNELLKMIEGGNIYAGTDEKNKKLVDTSKINFVMLGTFSELKNERRKTFGFISEPDTQDSGSIITRDTLHNSSQLSNEFLGRINGGIIEVEPMDEKKAEAGAAIAAGATAAAAAGAAVRTTAPRPTGTATARRSRSTTTASALSEPCQATWKASAAPRRQPARSEPARCARG